MNPSGGLWRGQCARLALIMGRKTRDLERQRAAREDRSDEGHSERENGEGSRP